MSAKLRNFLDTFLASAFPLSAVPQFPLAGNVRFFPLKSSFPVAVENLSQSS